VPLPLINFHKFIIGDEKWVLYDSPKKRKSCIDSGTIDIDCQIFMQKKFWCTKVKTELICTSNKFTNFVFNLTNLLFLPRAELLLVGTDLMFLANDMMGSYTSRVYIRSIFYAELRQVYLCTAFDVRCDINFSIEIDISRVEFVWHKLRIFL